MARLTSPVDEEELAALEDDYGNSNWDTDHEGSLGGAQFISAEEQAAIDDTIDMLSAQMKQFKIREPGYFLLILRDLAGAKCILQVPATACWHIRAKVTRIYYTKSAKTNFVWNARKLRDRA
ncbi:Nn.00g074880.m01.CDS01 [Neocucurbitaria sp. VM-36]